METLPAPPHRVFHSARSKGFKSFFLGLCLLLPATSLLFAPSFSVRPDQNGFYLLQKNVNSQTSAARKAQNVMISVALDSRPLGSVPIRLKTAPGLYLLRLSNAGQTHTVKVVTETD